MVVCVWTSLIVSLTWVAVQFIITKLNSNSILVTLNSRMTINADPFSRRARNLGRLPHLAYPLRSQTMGMGHINIAKTQVTHAETGEGGDHNSMTSQIERNSICLLNISSKSP